jgi:heptosyltransferase III
MQGQRSTRTRDASPGATWLQHPLPPGTMPHGMILGMILAMLFALASPFSIAASQSAIALLFLLTLLSPRESASALRAHTPIGLAITLYFLVQGLSILYSQHPLRSLIVLRGDLPVLFLPLFLVALRAARLRRLAFAGFIVSASLAAIVGLAQYATGRDPLGRATLEAFHAGGHFAVGSLGGHLTYGGVMMLAFVAAFASLLAAEAWRARIALLTAAALTGGGLLASQARTAWLGAAAGAGVAGIVFTVRRVRDRQPAQGRWRALAPTLAPALLLLVAGGLLIMLAPGIGERLRSVFDLRDDPRVRLWGTALRIFAAFPLFGAGLGGFDTHFPLYRLPGTYMATGHPHNDLLNALAHSGLAGGLAWFGLWFAIAKTGFARGRARRGPLLLAGLLPAFLVAGLGQCYFTDEEPAQALWFLVAFALSEGTEAGSDPRARAGSGRSRAPAGGNAPRPGARLPLGRRAERRAKTMLLPLACRLFPARPGPHRPLEACERILLVRQDNRLGNLVLMTPFLQALRELAPRARIGMVTGDYFGGLLEGSPWIDELIIERKRWLIRNLHRYPAHLSRIRGGEWDLAFELSNADTHSFYNSLLTQVSGAPQRVGFDHPRSRCVLDVPVAAPPGACHYSLAPLLLLSALGARPRIHAPRLPSVTAATARTRGRDHDRMIVVHPGGRGIKRWPAPRMLGLIRALIAQRRAPVVVIGGRNEGELLRDIAGELGGACDVRTLAGLDALIALLEDARLYIGCDAGPMHVAAALEVPTISLFLSSNPLRYAPLGERHIALLMGEGSRAYAAAAEAGAATGSMAAPGGPAGTAAWDAAFGELLARQRPRVSTPAGGPAAEAEIGFILEWVAERLDREEGSGA